MLSLIHPVDAAEAPGSAFRVRAGWAWALFVLTLAIYAACTNQVVYYTNPPTGDQPYYLHTAISIVQDGDIDEANNYAQWDESQYYPRVLSEQGYYPLNFPGIPAPFPLPPHDGKTTARPKTEEYSKHGLGLSVLVVPGWWLGTHWTPPWVDLEALDQPNAGWPVVVYEMNILGALLAVQVFLLAYEASRRLPIALLVWAALAFSNPLMTYSYLIFPELPAGLCAIYAFRRLALGWLANGPLRRVLIGCALAFLPWLHSRFLPITGALLLFALWQWWRARRASRPSPVASRQSSVVNAIIPQSAPAVSEPVLVPVGVLSNAEALPAADDRAPVLVGAEARLAGADSEPDFVPAGAASSAATQDNEPDLVPAGAASSAATQDSPTGTQYAVRNTDNPQSAIGNPQSSGPRIKATFAGLLLLGLPVLLSLGMLAGYYYWLYGTVLPNTADHAGFIDPISDPTGIPVAGLGLLFDQQWGLLIATPIYLLAAVGLAAMRRAPGGKAGFWWLLFATVPYIGLIMVYLQWWGEWCPPARYLAPVVPLLAWPLAQGLTALRNSTLYNLLFGFLTAPGWAVMAGMIMHPRAMWNHPNGQSELLKWVASQTNLDLSAHIPAIATWFYYHTYGKPSPVALSWPLVAAWGGLALAILMTGLLLLATTPSTSSEF